MTRRTQRRSLFERLEDRRLMSATYYVGPTPLALSSPDEAQLADINAVNSIDLQPGDRVLFEAGRDFGGSLAFNNLDGNKPSLGVVMVSSFTPVAGDSAIGQDPTLFYPAATTAKATLLSGNNDGISALNTSGFVISNLAIVGAGQAPATYNGIEFDNTLSGSIKLTGVTIDNVDVSGFGRYGISIGGSGGSGKSGFHQVRVTNATVHDNILGGIETHGVFSSTATDYANSDVYVGHCTVFNNAGYANSPNHSGDGIVLSDADGLLIERNVAYENGAQNTHVGGPVGIWVWDVNNAVIQHNESHHNRTNSTADGGGFDLDGGVTNSIVQYNYSHDNDGAGYGIYQFAGAQPFHDNVVRYNISANDGRKNSYGAIDFWNGNGSNGISNVEVYNNTVTVAPSVTTTTTTTTAKNGKTTTTTTTTKLGDPRALRFISGTTNVSIRNNIFQTSGGQMLAQLDARQTNLQIQGNDWWSSGAAFSIKSFAKVYTSLSAWISGTGYETLNGTTVGKNVEPGLTGPVATAPTIGNADLLERDLGAFKVKSDSALRDAGLTLSQFGTSPGTLDFYGDTLPAGTRYDIGADEYL